MKINWSRPIVNVYHALANKKLRSLFTTVFLFNAGFTFFTTFFAVFLITKFSYTQGNIGDFFAYIGLWVAFTQAVIVRRLANKLPEYKFVRYGLIGTSVATFLFFLPTQAWQLYFIVPIFAISNGLLQANVIALISRSADSKIQGEVMGINSSVAALAMSIPPVLSGYIAANLNPNAPIIVAGIVVLTAALVFWLFYKPEKVPVPEHIKEE